MHFHRFWVGCFATFRVYLRAVVFINISILTSIILKRPIVGHVQCVYFFIVESQHIFLSPSLSLSPCFFLFDIIFFSRSLKGFRTKTMSRNESSRLHRCCCCFSMSFISLRLFSISIRYLFGCTRNWSKTRWYYFVFGQPLKTWCCGYMCCAYVFFWNCARAFGMFLLRIGVNIVQSEISVIFCIFCFSPFFI